MIIDPAIIRAISFDCYGTLIDWETGILQALGRIFQAHGVPLDPQRALEAFSRHERELEGGRYMSYASVLGETMDRISRDFDLELGPGESSAIIDSMPDWPAFEETAPCLRRLQRHWKLAVVSNVDDEVMAIAKRQLGVEISVIVTSQQVKSYKPAHAHFEELLRRLNLPAANVLHVAESRHHDVGPASAMGFQTVWVNRHTETKTPSASGPGDAEPRWEVRSLRELCEKLGVWS